MPFINLELELTDEQVEVINDVLGDTEQQFALLAQPMVRGIKSGLMPLYVCTPEQYKLIDEGVREARKLEAFVK